MKLTRERKIYAAVCGLALALFGGDQLFNPKHAEASPEAPAAVVAPVVTRTATAATKASTVQSETLAQRLRGIAQGQNLNLKDLLDPFSGGAKVTLGLAPAAGDAFKTSHVLMAVMVSGRGGSAIINGKCIRVGETVDGYKLESIREGVANFNGATGPVELALNAEPAKSEAKPAASAATADNTSTQISN